MDGGRWNEHEEVHLEREGQMGGWGVGGGGPDGKRVREEEREAKCSERCLCACVCVCTLKWLILCCTLWDVRIARHTHTQSGCADILTLR